MITEPADADSAEIANELTAKAGELVANRYEADFDALYQRLAMFPKAVLSAPNLVGSSELASFRLMLWFTAMCLGDAGSRAVRWRNRPRGGPHPQEVLPPRAH
jgi:hypothetical protein